LIEAQKNYYYKKALSNSDEAFLFYLTPTPSPKERGMTPKE